MRTRYTSLILLLSLAVPMDSIAQMVYKGLGTSNSTFLLGHTSARHTQCLYLPSDLSANIGGDIVRLYYRYGTTAEELGNSLYDIRIRLGQTTSTGFMNGNVYFTGLDMGLNADTLTIPPGVTGEWFPIELETPFAYDPTQTLIIDIMFDTTATLTFGTYGTDNDGRKLRSPDTTSTIGSNIESFSWQDMGFDLENITGISHISTDRSPIVLPNPFIDQFQLALNTTGVIERLNVIDINGRSIPYRSIPNGNGKLIIALSDAPAGIYFLRATLEDGSIFTERVVKN